MLNKLRLWLTYRLCRHHWRPAATTTPPTLARHCDKCHRTESMKPASFYAQFGHVGIIQQAKRGRDLWP